MSTDLERFGAYCRRMAETDHDPLWTALADEVDAYLARGATHGAVQPGLFDD